MTVVALSAAYGALGSRIGPAVAERLNVPFVDRAIPLAVAEQLDVPVDDAEAFDERYGSSWLERMLRGFLGGDAGVPTPVPADVVTSDEFRRVTEEVLLRQADTGEGVILGRAAVIVLRERPGVLRVRLHGPAQARLRQAIELSGLGRPAAEQAMRKADRTHAAYVRQFYGASLEDASLYHLMLDTTVLAMDVAVDMVVAAAEAVEQGARL